MDPLLHTLLQRMMSQTYNDFTGEYTERTKEIVSVFDGELIRCMNRQWRCGRVSRKKARRFGDRLFLSDSKPKRRLASDELVNKDYQRLEVAFDLANKRGHSISGIISRDTKGNARSRSILRNSSFLRYMSRWSALRTRSQAREMGMYAHRVEFLRMLPRAEAFEVVVEELFYKMTGERPPWEFDTSSNDREEQESNGDFDDDTSDIDTVESEVEEAGEGSGIVGRIAVKDWGPPSVCLEGL
jgi:hypothetical protein